MLAACILAGGDWEGTSKLPRMVLCNAKTGAVLRRWNDSGKRARWGAHMAFAPDCRMLASSDGLEVHLWEVATGTEIRSFQGHRADIESLAFSGNGRRLATGSWDSTVLVWNVATEAGNQASSKESLAALWNDLANPDGRVAYLAIFRLADTPEKSVLLPQRLATTNARKFCQRNDRTLWTWIMTNSQFGTRQSTI